MARDHELLRETALLLLRIEVIFGTARALQSRLAAGAWSKARVTKTLRDGICAPLEGQVRLANSILEKLALPGEARSARAQVVGVKKN